MFTNEKYSKPNLLEKIRLWWEFDGSNIPYNFKYGIKNLIKWFPIIWRDRDWDDYYIWELLKFKLKKQSKYIGDRDNHLSAKEDAEIMMRCVELIDKIQTEFYSSEYMDYHVSNYDFVDIDENSPHYGKDLKELKIELVSERFDEYFVKYPEVYDYVSKHKKAQIFKKGTKQTMAMNIGHENHRRAKKELFKLLNDNIEKWWD